MMFKNLLLSLIILISIQIPHNVKAQENSTRPKIGVVLSGGGAKGFAHIPVLKMIDSLGIPIDYVAGTSMGALVGGLYAIGHSPEDIEKIVVTEDWLAMLDDAPLRRNIPILEKELKQNRLASIGVKSLKGSDTEEGGSLEVLYPDGYIAGQEVFDKILELTSGYHEPQNFLALPRGFLCVAADLKTGTEVVFTSGVLPHALRSTMSIPTMFSPNIYDGKMLVDGGAINNLPANHLKALGCDIIIGVNVSTPWSYVEDNPSVADILGQTGMFIDSKTAEERIALCDLYIEPDVYTFGVTSFGAKNEILKKGYEAAEKLKPELIALAKQLNETTNYKWPEYHFPDSIVIRNLIVEGLDHLTEKYVKSKFEIPMGQKIAYSLLDEKNKELFGTGKVRQTHFFLYKTRRPGIYDCELVVKEKKSETLVGVGFHYDSDLKTSILLSGEKNNLFFKGSRLIGDFVIGERPRARATYLLDAGRPLSFGVDGSFHIFNNSLYQDQNFKGLYQHFDKYAAIYALRTFANSAVLKLGASLNHSGYDIEDIPAGTFLDTINLGYDMNFTYVHFSPFLDMTVDRLDDAYVPKKGVYTKLRADFVFQSGGPETVEILKKPFFSVNFQWRNAWPAGKRATILTDLHVGANVFNRPSPTYYHMLGGAGDYFFNNQYGFLGYRYQELFMQQVVSTAAVHFRYQFMRQVYGDVGINVASFNTEWDEFTKVDHLGGAGIKVIWVTPFGPVSATVHSSFEDFDLHGYVSVGYNF